MEVAVIHTLCDTVHKLEHNLKAMYSYSNIQVQNNAVQYHCITGWSWVLQFPPAVTAAAAAAGLSSSALL